MDIKLTIDKVTPALLLNEQLPPPIFPMEIIVNGVGPATAEAGVKITINDYFDRRAGDEALLSIGGVVVRHITSEEDVTQGSPIDIIVKTDVWNEVGNGMHVCRYQLVDRAGNQSESSAIQIISVSLE